MTTKKNKTNPNRQYLLVAASCLIPLFGIACWWLSQGYAELSEQGFNYGMALMSACNRQDQARIEIIVESVTRDLSEKRLPERDAEAILGITRLAQVGDWKSANAESRRLLDAQVDSTLALQK